MFILNLSPTHAMQVRTSVLGEDGQPMPVAFTLQVKRLGRAAIEDVFARQMKGDLTDAALAREVVQGWGEDVRDAQGLPLPFSAAALGALLDVHPMPQAIAAAFYDSLRPDLGGKSEQDRDAEKN